MLLSHRVDNSRDTLNSVAMQAIPFSRQEDIRDGRCWIDWTEDEGRVHITYSEAFDAVAETFAVGYAHRIRGGVEMFGLLPQGVEVVARGMVTRPGGGSVTVADGPLLGASVVVPVPPDPDSPWSFTPERWRPFVDPSENMLAAWDDFEMYIATGGAPPTAGLDVLSDAVPVGPHRTIVNRPATVTLPLHSDAEASDLRPLIYNEATASWDPVLAVPKGVPPRVDANRLGVSFNVGWFVVARPG